jgi:hypothetical protein
MFNAKNKFSTIKLRRIAAFLVVLRVFNPSSHFDGPRRHRVTAFPQFPQALGTSPGIGGLLAVGGALAEAVRGFLGRLPPAARVGEDGLGQGTGAQAVRSIHIADYFRKAKDMADFWRKIRH